MQWTHASRTRVGLLLLLLTMGMVLLGSTAASATWAPGPNMLDPTFDAAATRLGDGTVLVIGGGRSNSFGAANQRFDPATGTWSLAGELLVPRSGLSLVTLLDGSGLAVGGSQDGTFPRAERYDPVTGTFTPTSFEDSGRGNEPGVAVLPDGRVLSVGGNFYDVNSNSASVYDPATNTWERRSFYPFFVEYAAVTPLADGRVLVAGGRKDLGDAGKVDTALVNIYDSASDRWSAAASLPASRVLATAVTLGDGRVLLTGGFPSSPALLYDVATDRWTPTGSLPAGAYPSRLVLLPDGRVLGIGGVDPGTGTTASALFDPATSSWANAGPLQAQRRAFMATLLADGRVLVAGGVDGAVYLASTELWTPGGTPPQRCTPHPGRGHGKAKGRHKHGHQCQGGPKVR